MFLTGAGVPALQNLSERRVYQGAAHMIDNLNLSRAISRAFSLQTQ
jgi:hypothetical protein